MKTVKEYLSEVKFNLKSAEKDTFFKMKGSKRTDYMAQVVHKLDKATLKKYIYSGAKRSVDELDNEEREAIVYYFMKGITNLGKISGMLLKAGSPKEFKDKEMVATVLRTGVEKLGKRIQADKL